MKKSVKIITSAATAVALLLGVSGAVYASEKTGTEAEDELNKTEEIVEEVSNEGSYELEENFSLDDEVAYVFTNYDGSINKVMDSVWIEEGNDKTEGADAKLPVDLKISYKLDGKEVTPSELEGKSGHLKITCDFTDNVYENKVINGKEEKIYVPYLASMITVFDDNNYENVTVSSGKVTYDGSRYAIVGLAFPGLSDDMGNSLTGIDIPDSIELEADVKDCEPAGLYLLVSDSLFSNLDLETDDEVGKLKDAMGQLTDAVNQLMDGSSKLYEGLGELETGANQISDGVTQLSDGLGQIDANSAALNDGALQVFNALLATATTQIQSAGVSIPALTIDNYNDVINGAIAQLGGTDVAGTARAKVEAGVKADVAANQAKYWQQGEDAARPEVEKAVREQVEAGVREKVEAAITDDMVRSGIKAQINASDVKAQMIAGAKQQYIEAKYPDYADKDDTDKATIDAEADMAAQSMITDDAVNAKIDEIVEQKLPSAKQATIDEKVAEQMNTPEVQALISQNIDGAMSSDEVKNKISQGLNDKMNQAINDMYNSAEVQSQIAAGNAKVSGGISSLRNLQSQLNSYAQFYQGIQSYTGAVGQAAAGANKLKDAMPEFVEGVEALRNGQGQLSDGLKKFDKDGIEELNGVVEDNVEGLAERFAAMNDVAADHNRYDESGNEKNGVKFIYKVSVSD